MGNDLLEEHSKIGLKNSIKRLLNNPFWDFWAPILLTFSLYIGIRNYIAEARYIPSGSMLPGLQINDRLVIEKISLSRRSPRRGEIIVFKSPFSFNKILRSNNDSSRLKCALINLPILSSIIGYRDQACYAYIKRVVAVSGDEVAINSKGEVLINNIKTNEPYVGEYCFFDDFGKSSCPPLRSKVPIGHVLVLGDNRGNSWDGRFWPGSPFLPEDQIIGRAIWRFWPINRFGILSF